MNKSYKYTNTLEGNTVVPIPSVTLPQIIYVDREGIGVRIQDEFDLGEVEADVYSFTRLSRKSFNFLVPGTMFQSSMSVVAGTYTRKYILIGASPLTEGTIYSIVIKGVDARYEVKSGDALADVYEGISTAISGATYPVGYTVTSSYTSTYFQININSGTLIGLYTIYADGYKFETGLFAKIEVFGLTSEYLIEVNEDYENYPAISSLAATYDYDLLTQMPNGYNDYLKNRSYPDYITTVNLYTELLGTATIEDVPFIVENSSRAVLDPNASQLIFSHKTPLKKNEIVKMLYK